jgi:hypothetical protein
MNKKVRNTNIEVLRLVLMMVIFCWHILVHGYGFKNIGGGGSMKGITDETGIVLSALFAPATYCFMFISGYYGLRFSAKKGISMEIWLIIISLMACLAGGFLFDSFSLRGLLTACFPVSTLRWWFMTSYMLIFLLSPILNKGIESLTKNGFLVIVVAMIVYQIISFLLLQENAGSNFLGLLSVFLMGRYCKIYKIEFKKHGALVLFVCCFLLLVGLMLLCDHYCKKIVFILLNYNTPLITMMAVALFYYVKGLKPRYSSKLNELLKPVLFIYLVTEGLSVRFYEWLVTVIDYNICLGILVYVLTIVGSLLIGHVVIRFVDKVLDNVNIQKIEDYVRQ